MRSHSLLLTPLLALLFALAVFSSPTTPLDPFHAIAAHAPKQPEPPVCCLRPLPSLENAEEDVLLSFEEWKAKQLSIQQDQAASSHPPLSPGHKPGNTAAADLPLEANISSSVKTGAPAVSLEQTEAPPPNAPYDRIPLTDRFNYASLDCSARVHTAHRSAKSVSSILSSKKDKYLLSPCEEKNQFIVVELCDDIRIDTVQLANYEFFSGVFKDFTILVAKTYTTDTDGWTFAGTYRARNVRGVQSFHPPETLTDFYRFIRINFQSHYGNEYYCPLSLLRVYGLTHLEHWKWDLWEAESRAKRSVEEVSLGSTEVVEQPPQPVDIPSSGSADVLPKTPLAKPSVTSSVQYTSQQPSSAAPATSENRSPANAATEDLNTVTPSPESKVLDTATASSTGISSLNDSGGAESSSLSTSPPLIPPSAVSPSTQSDPPNSQPIATLTQGGPSSDTEDQMPDTNDTSRSLTMDSMYNSVASLDSSTSVSVSLPSSQISSSGNSTLHSPNSSAPTPLSISSLLTKLNQSAQAARSASVSASPSAPANSQSLTVAPPPPPLPASSGESIYRTIMNRLIALETNTTLYARFVEDHTASVRDMLRRLSEDVGRLDGIGKAQSQNYQRSVAEFQRQQRRLELEHKELMSKVTRLTDEVVLEKRLGIAQLCLLLTVLVFMALTRGSRSEPVQGPEGSVRSRASSLRGWGTRTLNLSGEWVNKLKNVNRSLSFNGHDHEPISKSGKVTDLFLKIDFPSQGVQTTDGVPRSKRPHGFSSPRKVGIPVRPRTPSSARMTRHHSPQYPTTPTAPNAALALLSTARPPIQRVQSGNAMMQSFSMGVIGPVPKSAKRWARTAHLHQVRSSVSGASTSHSGPSKSAAARRDSSSREDSSAEAQEDIFTSLVELPTAQNSPNEQDRFRDAERTTLVLGRRNSRERLPMAFPSIARAAESEASEGDAGWVDTDIEGSDLELR